MLELDEKQQKIIQGWMELTLDSFHKTSVHQIADYFALLHFMRIYLIDNDMLPYDILTAEQFDFETVQRYLPKIWNYAEDRIIKAGLYEVEQYFEPTAEDAMAISSILSPEDRKQAHLGSVALIWAMVICMEIIPHARNFIKDLWPQLRRGIPYVYHRWQKCDLVPFKHNFGLSFLFPTMEEDIATTPAVLRKLYAADNRAKTIEELRASYDKNMQVYEDFIEGFKNLKHATPLILAMTHQLRLFATYHNFFPHEVWYDPDPEFSKLVQYIKPMGDYMNSIPPKGDDALTYVGAKVWYLTVFGLATPELYKEMVTKIWKELSFNVDEAYEIWRTRFSDTDRYANDVTQHLITSMPEDIKKIPAALR